MIDNIPFDCIWFDKGNTYEIAVECQEILKRVASIGS